mmetsp:Transcript_139286/g.246185  ORF Transcript_139286/g.246185 Transcript_139286/m.246185 type:complete len:102 (+) Transcript_139286:92-397(+)
MVKKAMLSGTGVPRSFEATVSSRLLWREFRSCIFDSGSSSEASICAWMGPATQSAIQFILNIIIIIVISIIIIYVASQELGCLDIGPFASISAAWLPDIQP